MKLLVTGATGYLGSHLVRALLGEGHQVTILKRSFSDTRRIIDLLPKISTCDIDRFDLEDLFQNESLIDAVIHTATCYGRKEERDTQIFETNTSLPLKLLDLAASYKVTSFINTDTSLPRTLNTYALSKKQFVDWGQVYAEQKKIHFVNIVLDHFYGPGDDETKFTTWITRSCLNNIPELELTSGEQKRDFVYIDDVVNALLLLINTHNKLSEMYQEFEVGNGKSVSIRKFAEIVKKISKASTVLNFGAIPTRPFEPNSIEIDASRIIELGWHCNTTLQEGIKKMIIEDQDFSFS